MKTKKKSRVQYHGKPGTKSLKVVREFFPRVTTIVDATKPLEVEVTPRDLTVAERKDHRVCAFAVACKRTTKADGVIIGLTRSYVVNGKTATRYVNGVIISREITSFDRKAAFDIGHYRLVPVCPSVQLGRYRPQPYHPKGGKPDRRRFRHFTGGVRTVLGQYTPPGVVK